MIAVMAWLSKELEIGDGGTFALNFECEISNARLGLCATRDFDLPLNAKPKYP
jgi:hypothetical protein